MRSWHLIAAIVCLALAGGSAQERPAESGRPTTLVKVNEVNIRVWLTGIDGRQPAQPLVILEAGAGAGLDYWTPEAVAAIAELAPVLAYDRRGIGGSAPDVVRPLSAASTSRFVTCSRSCG